MNYLYPQKNVIRYLTGFLIFLAGGLFAQAGMIDSTFGNNGVVLTDINTGSLDEIFSVMVQPDGKVVAAGMAEKGNHYDFALMRLLEDGRLDPDFGTGGIVLSDLGGEEIPYAAVLDEDKKIIATGYGNGGDFVTARYLSDGSLDESFGNNGIVFTDFFNDEDYANALILQADGKIVAGGTSIDPNKAEGAGFALIRFNSDGAPDTTFGDRGKVFTQIGPDWDEINSLVVQPDGRLIAGGYTTDDPGNKLCIARYDPDGTLDPSFGSGGIVVDSFNSEINEIRWTGLLPDGKIVIAGRGGNQKCGLARYHADGTPDRTFNGTGKLIIDPSVKCQSISSGAVSGDGKVLITGAAQKHVGGTSSNFFLGRINQDGSIDTTFADNGFVVTKITPLDNHANAITPTADGKIIAAGVGNRAEDTGVDFALVRYLNDSQVVSALNFENPARDARVYPNPMVNSAVLRYDLAKEQRITIRLLDTAGRPIKVFAQDQWQVPGSYQQPITIPGTLPSGLYLIQISSPYGQVCIKVVK